MIDRFTNNKTLITSTHLGMLESRDVELYRNHLNELRNKIDNSANLSYLDEWKYWEKAKEKVIKYMGKLDGLTVTVLISDIAKDLNLSEECVMQILDEMNMELSNDE